MLNFVEKHLKLLIKNTRGATMMEYALIVSLMVLSCIGIFKTLGGSYATIYDRITSDITDA